MKGQKQTELPLLLASYLKVYVCACVHLVEFFEICSVKNLKTEEKMNKKSSLSFYLPDIISANFCASSIYVYVYK